MRPFCAPRALSRPRRPPPPPSPPTRPAGRPSPQDTGLTMTKLIPQLLAAGAASVRVAALLEKRTPHSCGFKADFVGFSVPDAFVVGYNLDYNEAFREMPHICVINAAGIDFFRAHPQLKSLN
jgi:hypothetical protein